MISCSVPAAVICSAQCRNGGLVSKPSAQVWDSLCQADYSLDLADLHAVKAMNRAKLAESYGVENEDVGNIHIGDRFDSGRRMPAWLVGVVGLALGGGVGFLLPLLSSLLTRNLSPTFPSQEPPAIPVVRPDQDTRYRLRIE